MGSASREALRAAVDQLVATTGVTVATGDQLLSVGRAVDDSAQLRGVVDGSADDQQLLARGDGDARRRLQRAGIDDAFMSDAAFCIFV